MANFDISSIVQGPGFPGAGPLHTRSLTFLASAPDLSGPVILKGRLGHHYQAISRNGRVLILSDTVVRDTPGRLSLFTLHPWRKTILPENPPEIWGVILRVLTRFSRTPMHYTRIDRAEVTHAPGPSAWLSLALGAHAFLVFSKSSDK